MGVQEKYSYVRGFNFQPPWGNNGHDIWLNFNENEYRRLISCAKQAFPNLNTLRVWLSFEAWYDGRERCIENIRKAGSIIAEEGLNMIPVYFNGWHSVPDFGGFTFGSLSIVKPLGWEPMKTYLRQACAALESTGAVLISDISNEPLNNALSQPDAVALIHDFLKSMADELHRLTSKPVCIGSQGYRFNTPLLGCDTDLDLFNDCVDVITVHPYSVCMTPKEKHKEYVQWLIEEADRLGKDILITECCWDAENDKTRGDIVRLELGNYKQLGIGFVVHALSPSPVADLHLKDGINPGFFMPFMYLDGTVRPYHEFFREV